MPKVTKKAISKPKRSSRKDSSERKESESLPVFNKPKEKPQETVPKITKKVIAKRKKCEEKD